MKPPPPGVTVAMWQAANRREYLKALRSGRYAQAFGSLREGNCYCALGVLCDTLDPEGWAKTGAKRTVRSRVTGEDVVLEGWAHRRLGAVPHQDLVYAVGLEGAECVIQEANDTEGLSLSAIADLIEQLRPIVLSNKETLLS